MFASATAFAEIKMPQIFSDNMMLQRDMPVKVWGGADPNANVEVDFAGQKKTAIASADGSWSVTLDTMNANADPQEMSVSENGKVSKKIGNVLVGEVWVLGGQSNMEWRLKSTLGADAAYERAHYPKLRYFRQSIKMAEIPQKDSPKGAAWTVADGENVGGYSAVGFYFGEQLMKDLDVPVGLVYAARGATKMACWIPEADLNDLPYLKSFKADFDKENAEYTPDAYQKKLAEYKETMRKAKEEDEKLKEEGKPAKKRSWLFGIAPNPISPRIDFQTPSYLFNGMVAPFAGWAARGTIWYQGESDTHPEEALNCFEDQLRTVVEAWRKNFANENMYFFWVQLASYTSNGHWAEARWRQLQAVDKISKSGVANIIDTGEEHYIHPHLKTPVGIRLEKIALRDVYGFKNVHPYGPIMKDVSYSGDEATVSFDLDGRGLVGKGEPRGFEVFCNGKWVTANVSLKGSEVAAKSPDGSKVEGVRYLWKDWAMPDVWLYNEDNLPAFSFTDQR